VAVTSSASTNANHSNTTTTTAPIPMPTTPPPCQVIDAQVAALQAVINNLKTQGCPVQSIPTLQTKPAQPSSPTA
jgi:hypothetical protein